MLKEDTLPANPFVGNCLSMASFWVPQHLVLSAWVEHGPFAFWIVDSVRPRTVVELGTHNGYSFFAFCQAAKTLGLPTACYAIDTWEGDDHAGYYGDDIFALVSGVQQAHYADIATLVRSTFDDALPYFPDHSIDLLHIDGRHGYNDVRHDFETWLPKLSDRAIVLFHDINVRERDFGVWKLWDELKNKHPSFEFVHGHGLGVLCVGSHMPEGMRLLFKASEDSAAQAAVRTAYGRLGKAASDAFNYSRDLQQLSSRLHEAQALHTNLTAQIEAARAGASEDIAALREAMSTKLKAQETEATEQRVNFERANQPLEATTRSLQEKCVAFESELADARARFDRQHAQLVRQRLLTENHSQERYKWMSTAQGRHPLAMWIDRWTQHHPRRARWVWRFLRAGHMVATLQLGRLMRTLFQQRRSSNT